MVQRLDADRLALREKEASHRLAMVSRDPKGSRRFCPCSRNALPFGSRLIGNRAFTLRSSPRRPGAEKLDISRNVAGEGDRHRELAVAGKGVIPNISLQVRGVGVGFDRRQALDYRAARGAEDLGDSAFTAANDRFVEQRQRLGGRRFDRPGRNPRRSRHAGRWMRRHGQAFEQAAICGPDLQRQLASKSGKLEQA